MSKRSVMSIGKIFKYIFPVIFILCAVFVSLYFVREEKFSFESLGDFEKYAAFYEEIPKIEIDDWKNPDFTQFYRISTPSLFKRVLRKIGLVKGFAWSIDDFTSLLEEVIALRTEKKIDDSSRVELMTRKGDRYFIWGDLHGAIHSFVRCLRELNKMGIIGEDLVIKDNSRFVLLGDAISRSPHSVELLNAVLVLMKKNPDKIFYVRGRHETRGHWEDFSMYREVEEKSSRFGISSDVETLSKKINCFFDTLPELLTLGCKNGCDEKVVCAHSKFNSDLLQDIQLKSVISGAQHLDLITGDRGLKFMGYDYSASIWSLFSSPSVIYRKFFKFHCDAFVELLINDPLTKSLLILHSRDVNNEKNFREDIYDLIFASKFKTRSYENEGKPIANVGSTMALSGVTGPLGRETKNGVETSLMAFNNDSSAKKLVKFSVIDDGYNPRLARKNAKSFLHDYGIDTLLMPGGTPTLTLYLDMVKSGKLAVLFPYSGGSQFRVPELKNMVHYRASYDDEVKSAIRFLVKEYGIKKFAFFYQNDSYGRPAAEAARKELKRLGIETSLDLPHGREQRNFSFIIDKKLKRDMPEAIGCVSSHFPTQELIDQLGTEFFVGRIIFGVSFLYSQAFQKFLEDRGADFLPTSVVPDSFTSDLEIVKEHRERMKMRGLLPTTNSLEGYIAAELFVDAVRHLEPPFTKEKIIAYFESFNNYKFKGLTLTFNPERRDFSQHVWLRTFEGKWIIYD